MDLSRLIALIAERPAFMFLQGLPQENEAQITVLEAAKPALIACLFRQQPLPLLVITASPEKAARFQEQLITWCGKEAAVLLYPALDVLPYEELAPDPAIVHQRLQVLSRLAEPGNTSFPLVIASAAALMPKIISRADFSSLCQVLQPGISLDPLELLARCRDMGYEIDHLAEVPGTMSRRGGILDIYPPSSPLPLRIEFIGNEIESLRFFDPATQRSLQPVPSALIAPTRESSLSATGGLLDYLSPSALLVLDEMEDLKTAFQEIEVQAQQRRGREKPDGPSPYLFWSDWGARLKERSRIILQKWLSQESSFPLPFHSAPVYGGKLHSFFPEVRERLREGYRLVIVSHQASRLQELLAQESIPAPFFSSLEQLPSPGNLALVQGSLPQGWIMEEVILLTDQELFGLVKERRPVRKHPVRREAFLSDLSEGDYVVHIEHGIARFAGMTRLTANGAEREYLVLEYAAGDRLYVPTDQVDRVSHYIGSGEPPALSRLGSQEWTHLKQKAKEAARETAQELLSLYAVRQVLPGFSFSPDTLWQQELEASFPYVETPDQWETVQEVKGDMEQPKPMDRLVCGDVGYGKTEVALRAAFKAVLDGKQVAMLVPTTVLAQQHFSTFSQRLATFPVKVEMLSRFRTEREQEAILQGLAQGSVDICIGTHRLLQKDVVFHNLGLVIIDEEQRFGVAHKEILKQLRREVDVLALSATPIPRTLHMSLSGVRDMSVMETPPEERLSIKTYVGHYDARLVKEAITRELERNGQVFVVHNRVQTILRLAQELRELVPQARIAIGHGQMPEEELEKGMLDFSQGKIEVLLCTTIIESGLDIPNANTLIVTDAHRLGLSQLYQLRGRVGRCSQRAYAYFFYPKGAHLTPAAEKRLQTIFEATELGAGFHIAMKDLEIRGAGNLLGSEQSGHIAAVGFDLYCRLLSQAVEELKVEQEGKPRAEVHPSLPPPLIDLPLSAHLPPEYIPAVSTRLALYHRFTRLKSVEEINDIKLELVDRFGKLPAEAENLLYVVKIKILAFPAGVQSISTEDSQIVLRFREGIRLEGKKMERAYKQGLSGGTSQLRLDLNRLGSRWRQALEEVLQ